MSTPETREVFYDWEAELPSGLWSTGVRKLKMRTTALVHGHVNDQSRFISHRVVRVVGHEVDPPGWTPPPEPDDKQHRSQVSV